MSTAGSFDQATSIDRSGMPNALWKRLQRYSGATDQDILAMLASVQTIANAWGAAIAGARAPGPSKIDEAGHDALNAFSQAFRHLSQSKSHRDLSPILRRMSPFWQEGDRFYLSTGDEHDAVWPAEFAQEIDEFIGKNPGNRPMDDSRETVEAAEKLLKAWRDNFRLPPSAKENMSKGATYHFIKDLAPYIMVDFRAPLMSPTGRKRRGHVHPPTADELTKHFTAVMPEAVRRAIKREQAARRAPRERHPAVTQAE